MSDTNAKPLSREELELIHQRQEYRKTCIKGVRHSPLQQVSDDIERLFGHIDALQHDLSTACSHYRFVRCKSCGDLTPHGYKCGCGKDSEAAPTRKGLGRNV